MPKISVLTPLYNTEPDQLKEMIESVLAQSFSDFEFLLLNDSPDNAELESLVKGFPIRGSGSSAMKKIWGFLRAGISFSGSLPATISPFWIMTISVTRPVWKRSSLP